MPLPTGIISIWSGAIVDIPTGWALCDGSGGTPDLRDRFIVGAGSSYSVADTGGAINHTHSFTSDAHNHTFNSGSGLAGGAYLSNTTSNNVASGTTDAEDGRPPYYSLAFIMKT